MADDISSVLKIHVYDAAWQEPTAGSVFTVGTEVPLEINIVGQGLLPLIGDAEISWSLDGNGIMDCDPDSGTLSGSLSADDLIIESVGTVVAPTPDTESVDLVFTVTISEPDGAPGVGARTVSQEIYSVCTRLAASVQYGSLPLIWRDLDSPPNQGITYYAAHDPASMLVLSSYADPPADYGVDGPTPPGWTFDYGAWGDPAVWMIASEPSILEAEAYADNFACTTQRDLTAHLVGLDVPRFVPMGDPEGGIVCSTLPAGDNWPDIWEWRFAPSGTWYEFDGGPEAMLGWADILGANPNFAYGEIEIRATRNAESDTPAQIVLSKPVTVYNLVWDAPPSEAQLEIGTEVDWTVHVTPALDELTTAIDWRFETIDGETYPMEGEGVTGSNWQSRVWTSTLLSDNASVEVYARALVRRISDDGWNNLQPGEPATGGVGGTEEVDSETPLFHVTLTYPNSDTMTAWSFSPDPSTGEPCPTSIDAVLTYQGIDPSTGDPYPITLASAGDPTGILFIKTFTAPSFSPSNADWDWEMTDDSSARALEVMPIPRPLNLPGTEGLTTVAGSFTTQAQLWVDPPYLPAFPLAYIPVSVQIQDPEYLTVTITRGSQTVIRSAALPENPAPFYMPVSGPDIIMEVTGPEGSQPKFLTDQTRPPAWDRLNPRDENDYDEYATPTRLRFRPPCASWDPDHLRARAQASVTPDVGDLKIVTVQIRIVDLVSEAMQPFPDAGNPLTVQPLNSDWPDSYRWELSDFYGQTVAVITGTYPQLTLAEILAAAPTWVAGHVICTARREARGSDPVTHNPSDTPYPIELSSAFDVYEGNYQVCVEYENADGISESPITHWALPHGTDDSGDIVAVWNYVPSSGDPNRIIITFPVAPGDAYFEPDPVLLPSDPRHSSWTWENVTPAGVTDRLEIVPNENLPGTIYVTTHMTMDGVAMPPVRVEVTILPTDHPCAPGGSESPGSWHVTTYYTPWEESFYGPEYGFQRVNCELFPPFNGIGSLSLREHFYDRVTLEGFGRLEHGNQHGGLSGMYIGYSPSSDTFQIYQVPVGDRLNPLTRFRSLATHPGGIDGGIDFGHEAVFGFGPNNGWNGGDLCGTAADVGVAIEEYDIDVYVGEMAWEHTPRRWPDGIENVHYPLRAISYTQTNSPSSAQGAVTHN